MMKRSCVVLGASLLLTGCITNERGELIGRSEFYRMAEKAKSAGLLTPAVVEECSSHVLQIHNNARGVRIVGPFKISTSAEDHRDNDRVAVVAPVNLDTRVGEWKVMSGCLYRLESDRLVFDKAKSFGRRMDVTLNNPTTAPRQEQ